MTTHDLKTYKIYFDDLWNNKKKFEIRVKIIYIFKDIDNKFLKKNFIIFCFKILKRYDLS